MSSRNEKNGLLAVFGLFLQKWLNFREKIRIEIGISFQHQSIPNIWILLRYANLIAKSENLAEFGYGFGKMAIIFRKRIDSEKKSF